jgi:putative hydrolase of HD superfamily
LKYLSVINFLKEVEKFKTCERTCHTSASRPESDAEHSWHLALFLLAFEDQLSGLDFSRMLKLALIHDLPELYAGDTNPYRGDVKDKEAQEMEAAKELFAMLPAGGQDRFMDLFQEYLEQKSPEARVVKSADKLLPLIQNLCTNGDYSSYRSLKVRYAEVEAYMDKFFSHDGLMRELYRFLLAEADKNGVFYDRSDDAK